MTRMGALSASAATIPVLTSLGTTVAPVLSHRIAASLHVSVASTALIVTLYTVGLCATTPVAGQLVDRFGTRAPLRFGGVLLLVSSVLTLAVSTLATLLAIRVVQGSASALIATAAFTRISRGAPVADRARRLGRLTAGTSVMYGTGPLLGSALGGALGWRVALTAPTLAALVALAESRRDERRSMDPAFQRPNVADRRAITRLLRRSEVRRLLIAGAALNGTSLSIAFLVPVRLEGSGIHTLSVGAGAWLLPSAAVAAATALLAARTTRPIGRVLAVTALIAGSGVLLAGVMPVRATLVIAASVATAGFAASQVLLLSRLPDYVTSSDTGTALSIATLSMLLGGIAGTALTGLVLALTGSATTLGLLALLPLAAVSAWRVPELPAPEPADPGPVAAAHTGCLHTRSESVSGPPVTGRGGPR
jgi:predicted MFS family arabinose efflux permease